MGPLGHWDLIMCVISINKQMGSQVTTVIREAQFFYFREFPELTVASIFMYNPGPLSIICLRRRTPFPIGVKAGKEIEPKREVN